MPPELPAADELDRAVQQWQVADALASLSAQHRAVLLETYYRGGSIAEASATLGIPAGTVKSRSYYALRGTAAGDAGARMERMSEPDAALTSLGAYVLGALSPTERAEVGEHLRGCSGCREELAGLAGFLVCSGRWTRRTSSISRTASRSRTVSSWSALCSS